MNRFFGVQHASRSADVGAMRHRRLLFAATVLGVAWASADLSAQQRNAFGHEILPVEREIELALSAAPPAIARDAGVWALKPDGFEQVRQSTNGFNCMIQRANNVEIVAPTCFDAEASRSIMEIQLYQGTLWAQGRSAEDVTEAVAGAFRSGRLRPPARGSVGFMLSSGQRLGAAGQWRPHMMIYAPYVTAEEIGADVEDPKNPLRMLNPGQPDARIVVIVQDFVDPTEVKQAARTESGRQR